MKVYFTSPVSFNSKHEDYSAAVKDALTDTRSDVQSVYGKFKSVDEYRQLTDDQGYEVFKESEKALKEADIVIAEVSEPSNRIGFEIAVALAERKPVLAIANKSVASKLSPPIQGNKSKYLSVYAYDGKEDLTAAVKKFINDAKKQLDTKFILIISPQIDKYLEWVAQERRMHKAQVVRESIEGAMNKDKEYQTYLKDSAV